MQKRSKLTAALSETPAEQRTEPDAPRPAHDARAPKARTSKTRADRIERTNVTGYFPLAVKWQLQELATARYRRLGRKVNLQELLAEALNDLFKKEGMPEIAPTGGDDSE